MTDATSIDPVRARDGRRLFFRREQALFAVNVTGPDPSRWEPPTRVTEGPYVFRGGPREFDVAPDGRLLMLKNGASDQSAASQFVLVQNWFEELKRLLPENWDRRPARVAVLRLSLARSA